MPREPRREEALLHSGETSLAHELGDQGEHVISHHDGICSRLGVKRMAFFIHDLSPQIHNSSVIK